MEFIQENLQGIKGSLKVEVTISGEKITEVKVLDNVETVGIGSKALDALSKSIAENNSVGVDTLSGATASSKAIISAVTNAIEVAGGDILEKI